MADELIETHLVREGWFNVVTVKARIGGDEIERDIVEHPSGAAILPYDPDRRVALMIMQTRLPVLASGEGPMIEVIAGALDGEAPDLCARREAMEEGGVRLDRLEPVARVWPTPATSTERVDYFLAEYRRQDRVGRGGGLNEEQEHLRVCEVPLGELWRRAEAGELRDAKTLTLVQALRIRRAELFE
jgi:nudix-type nucleoside diphosphatase (YffH/AdpP family)